METNRPGYYAIIPADVRYDDSIPAAAKLLYGEISALINKDGFCYATNPYFAQIYRCSEDSVSRWITALVKAGYIKREVVKDKTGQIVQRKLYLSVSAPGIQPSGKISDTPLQNFSEGTRKNAEDTITSITNIEKENIKEKAKGRRRVLFTDEEMQAAIVQWIKDVEPGGGWPDDGKNALYLALARFYAPRESKKLEPTHTKAGFEGLCNKLLKCSGGRLDVMIELLDNATIAGWKSVYPKSTRQATQEPEQRPTRANEVIL